MNFLAHIYLSGDNELVQIGNLMADGIRGKRYDEFPPDVRTGILLHREIDTFTDAHPIFRESTKRLHSHYHHYAGVIVDVFYDHFLAHNWTLYSTQPLEDFVARFYDNLERHYDLLTDRTRDMMPPMIRHNWLLSYRDVDGIARIMTQMDHRTGNVSGMRNCVGELLEYYEEFGTEFRVFFEELRTFCRQKLPLL
ncbi:MAG TPA: ACP phosphodiesterase [Flavobacterium sp.]|nr:ACP phosphodiesterase [Flavobacterium sp.]